MVAFRGSCRQWVLLRAGLIFHPYHILLFGYEPLMSSRDALFDPVLFTTDSTFSHVMYVYVYLCVREPAMKCEWVKESETVLCLRFAETGKGFADKQRGQVTAQRDYHKEKEEEEKRKRRHKRLSLLVPLHQPSVFPLTHCTQKKTDFKGEDEKHSLLKAKCLTMGPCANTVVLSEKWPTDELTNRSSLGCASHSAWEPNNDYVRRLYTYKQTLWPGHMHLRVYVSHKISWQPSLQLHIKRIQKIHLCWNTWELLGDLTHKQYISSLPVKACKPLLRTGSSLTMFITDIQKQLRSTRCWGRTGPGKAPKAEWGQVQDQVSGSSKLQKGNKDSDIPFGSYETWHRRRWWEENHSSLTVKGTRKSKPNGTMV